jgi:hypothetical protein
MPGIDRTGTWIEGAAVRRGRGYRTEVIESEKHNSSNDPEIGYRPLIYTVPPKLFSWSRLFRWLWNRNSS